MKIWSNTVDGAHISALLLRLFVMYFPQLIEAGMVYKGVPPLYAIKEGKKNKFFTEQIDIVKFIQKDFLSKHSLLDIKKNELENRDITKFFLKNADYTYYLLKAANTYAVDPYLLEMTLFNYIQNNHSIDEKKLAKSVKSTYRFMDVLNKNGQTIISGSIEESNLIICRDKLFNDCKHIIDIMEKNDSLYYTIDGKLCSLYQVMMMYEESTPSNVQRFKGLGEMQKDSIVQSTLDPNQDRTLIRYTMDDIKEATSIIREYESDTKKILGEVKRIDRFDLLD